MVEFGSMFVIRIVIPRREPPSESIMTVFESVGFTIILPANGATSYKKKIGNKRFFVVGNFCYSKLSMTCKWIIVNIWMLTMYLFKFIQTLLICIFF